MLKCCNYNPPEYGMKNNDEMKQLNLLTIYHPKSILRNVRLGASYHMCFICCIFVQLINCKLQYIEKQKRKCNMQGFIAICCFICFNLSTNLPVIYFKCRYDVEDDFLF